MKKHTEIKIPALEFKQGKNKKLYCFAVNGKILPDFTTISRISRDEDQEIGGYQRPEVISHIANIKKYLESSNPMIPNAIVVAFNNKVSFQPLDHGAYSEHSKSGLLKIPMNEGLNSEKPGWIVDGQQRVAAIRDAELKSFPIAVVGFITADETEQREQFILVNSTKPLPKGLIYELLPTTETELPTQLQRKRFPSEILQKLNCDSDSPLFGMISTPTTPKGIIKDNSILKMLENSLSDGTLFQFREGASESKDMDSILKTLKSYWGAVAKIFKDAWNLQPRKSRLMHGAGIVSMGFLMDAISDRYRHLGSLSQKKFEDNLAPLKDFCRWTNGFWDFGGGIQRKWNEIQNTPKDIQILTNFMLNKYREKMQD
jgi:DGQHR domain-containing protein